ncbi:glycosyltransferase [Aerosakkonemataceae cyanobacterium BLCC-F154]|uniref:Glycosyltransferase n=1 Tax=Floridaenema fluviatile BLCC-F154 TaxID=3153640 RepID=A0ABV4YCY3_9CYAN
MTKTSPSIAILLRSLHGGGAERVIVNLVSGFAEKGIKMDLVLLKAEGTYLSQVSKEARIVDFNASKFDRGKRWRLPTSFQSTSSLPKLINYLQQEQPKILLSATHFTNEIAILAKHLSRTSTRVVVTEHTTVSVEAKRVEQISARLIPLTSRIFYPWADGIVTVSQGVAQNLANITKLPKERIQTIYNPVITPEILQMAKEPLDHPWFANGEPPVILGVGRFVKQKDFPTLIKAFAEVRKQQLARLMILGGGRERSNLESLVSELNLENDVALLNFVKNPFAYMARAAVFVLSSAWEGLPTVLIEAMAVGTNVVATNCPSGSDEILANGKYGFLVPVGDSSAIAQAILSILSGNTKQIDSEWLNQFTLDNSTQNYLNFLGISEK